MALDAKNLVDSYVNWLKSNIHPTRIGEYWQITTPFLDRHNDHLQIYVKEEDGRYILTDDGYVIADLAMCGCEINSSRRREVVEQILVGFGVRLDDEALVTEATANNFPQKKHLLLQAMLAVNDMFMMSTHRVQSVFLEDVQRFLDEHEVRYVASIQLNGRSGFAHNFDFVIPSSKERPERLVRTLNAPTKDKTQSVLFAWTDVSAARGSKLQMYVFLNDTDRKIRNDVMSAFREYRVTPIPWSERQKYITDLVA